MTAQEALPPEVSVVIPCWNRTEMLRDCMRGLARQSIGFARFEVVLVDNCSTDDLSVVVEEARAMGMTIRLARLDVNRGPAPARNLGVSLAAAPIIAFTDSDCRPSAEWLEAALPHFADPRVAFISGPVLPKAEQHFTLTSRATFVNTTEHPSFPTANLVMRRELFVAHGGFNTELSFADPWGRATECADTDLAWRILKSGHERRFEPRAAVEHEIEQMSTMMWIIDPSRMFVLPELVRRHPELRQELLTFGTFFYLPSKLLYLFIPVMLLVLVYAPALLLALPALLLLRGIQRTRSLNPAALAAHALRVTAHLPRMIILNAALLYGSIRFRSLVL